MAEQSAFVPTELGFPEVAETDSETLSKMFVELDEAHTASFLKTLPSDLSELGDQALLSMQGLTVQSVMAVARRHNRVCPVESEWQRLHAILQSAAADAPAPLTGVDLRRAVPLVRRIRVRDQVEWASQRGLLPEVCRFLAALPEELWLHMGD